MTKSGRFGEYTLLSHLGRGGMGEVLLARFTDRLGRARLAAVKRLSTGWSHHEMAGSMLLDEAHVASQLSHENIARIFDYGQIGRQCYLAMEYVHGRDLRSILHRLHKQRLAMPVALACHIGMQICAGLHYAHNRRCLGGHSLGIVHRDLSLRNVLLSFDGAIKIIDFGVAKATCRHVITTDTGVIKGTPSYMSPEQIRAEPLDHRSDIFACGILLFELLTGRRLFTGNSIPEILRQVCQGSIPRVSAVTAGVPDVLQAIVARALERDRCARYQSARELHSALAGFVDETGYDLDQQAIAFWMKALYQRVHAIEAEHLASLLDGSDHAGCGSRERSAEVDCRAVTDPGGPDGVAP